MTDFEKASILCGRRSLFRRARWLRRDAVIGICLWLVALGSVYAPGVLFIGESSRIIVLAVFLALYVGIQAWYPAWAVRRRTDGPIHVWPGIGGLLKEALIAVPMTACVLMLGLAIKYAWKFALGGSQLPPGPWAGLADYLDFWSAALLCLMAVIVAPVVEEVFFRGFLYNALRCVCPVGLAICLQAVLFAVVHPFGAANMAVVACYGLALAAVYEWRKTLLAPIFLHAMLNGLVVIGLVVAMAANAKAPALGIHGAPDANGQFVVDHVFSQTGAEKADLRPGDVIRSYNDVAVRDHPQLIKLVRAGKVGDTVRIEVLRGGNLLEKRVILKPRGEAFRSPIMPAR